MYPSFSLKNYLKELIRPWKLITFSIAMGYYIWGVYYYQTPTWDVPVSWIMGILTYVFAPWVVKSAYYLIQQRPKHWIIKLLVCFVVTYGCASGSYELYHVFWGIGYHPPTYWINLYYSTLVFIAAGIFWKFEGTFNQLWSLSKSNFFNVYKKNKVRTIVIIVFIAVASILGFIYGLKK